MRMLRWIGVVIMITAIATSNVSAESIRFAVIADTRGNTDEQPINDEVLLATVDAILETDPPVQFVIILGDLVRGARYGPVMDRQFEDWKRLVAPWYQADFIGLKVYPVPGNHDQVHPSQYLEIWQRAFGELPDNGPRNERKMTYSFSHGPVHFSVVNTSAPTLSGAHVVNVRWLAEDLSRSDKPIKFVLGHEPAFPKDRHVGSSLDAYPNLRDIFWQTLVDHEVKGYLCGHTHVYDHWIKDGVHQIDAGSAGAPGPGFVYLIFEADEHEVKVEVYDTPTGLLIEEYYLSDTESVRNEDRSVRDDYSRKSIVETMPCFLWMVLLVAGMGVVGKAMLCQSDVHSCSNEGNRTR